MVLAADVCKRLAAVKEDVMGTWAKEMGAEAAIEKWQKLIRQLPQDTSVDQLPEDIRLLLGGKQQ